jgi:phosphoglycolate phosphatase-like HAD superfamily hydrolase
MMIANLIWDWSGTISDDLPNVYEACMRVFDAHKVPRISLVKFRNDCELPFVDFYARHIPGLSIGEEGRLFNRYFDSLPPPKPFPDAAMTLDELVRKHVRMLVLSSHPEKSLRSEARRYKLPSFFVALRGGVYDKIKAINGVMAEYCFEKSQTCFVGDMPHDILAGKHAGIDTVAVTWGYKRRQLLEPHEPTIIVDTWQQLLGYVNDNLSANNNRKRLSLL